VIDDVPPNCTVVGVPGRVVVRSGERIETVDLHHEDLPDPVVEMFRCLQRRLDRVERRVAGDTTVRIDPADGDACPVGDESDPIVFNAEGWHWEI
jgi:hypothetical protein